MQNIVESDSLFRKVKILYFPLTQTPNGCIHAFCLHFYILIQKTVPNFLPSAWGLGVGQTPPPLRPTTPRLKNNSSKIPLRPKPLPDKNPPPAKTPPRQKSPSGQKPPQTKTPLQVNVLSYMLLY